MFSNPRFEEKDLGTNTLKMKKNTHNQRPFFIVYKMKKRANPFRSTLRRFNAQKLFCQLLGRGIVIM